MGSNYKDQLKKGRKIMRENLTAKVTIQVEHDEGIFNLKYRAAAYQESVEEYIKNLKEANREPKNFSKKVNTILAETEMLKQKEKLNKAINE